MPSRAILLAVALSLILAGLLRADHGPPDAKQLFAKATQVLVGRIEKGPDKHGSWHMKVLHAIKGEFTEGMADVAPGATHGCACDGRTPEIKAGEVWLMFLTTRDEERRVGFVGHANNAWFRLSDASTEEPKFAPALAALTAIAAGASEDQYKDVIEAAKTGKSPDERYLNGYLQWRAEATPAK